MAGDLQGNAKAIFYETLSDQLTKRPDGPVVLAGRYQIVRKLGEGGMGSVWLAEDAKLDGRQVAIKMLPVVLATNARAIQQLKAEAKVAMQLSHSNIVTLRSFEDSDEGAFLVMDYVPGKTLEDILADKGTLTEDEVLRIFRPIAEALDYAHRQKVIHRDIKPSNILIREDGEPFIMDFGIAREMKDTMTRVTGRNSSGTLPYMSPEQLRGEAPTPAQDIYSLAATIYECLSGHPPFHRGEIAHQIEHSEPEPLASNSPLARTATAGLAKVSERRPATAGELVGGAESTLRNARIARTAGRAGPARWGWKAVLCLAVLAVLAAGGFRGRRAISSSSNQQPKSKDHAETSGLELDKPPSWESAVPAVAGYNGSAVGPGRGLADSAKGDGVEPAGSKAASGSAPRAAEDLEVAYKAPRVTIPFVPGNAMSAPAPKTSSAKFPSGAEVREEGSAWVVSVSLVSSAPDMASQRREILNAASAALSDHLNMTRPEQSSRIFHLLQGATLEYFRRSPQGKKTLVEAKYEINKKEIKP